jgi:glutamate dehydrogenase/leucine dehydrogenase
MKWMVEEYIKFEIRNSKFEIPAKEKSKLLATFTGKPVDFGGSLGRTEATGRGGSYILQALLNKLKSQISNSKSQTNSKFKNSNSKNLEFGACNLDFSQPLTVAVQGFGNVGFYMAKFLYEAGFKIVALSDSAGAIVVNNFKKDSFNPDLVYKCKKEKGKLANCYCIGSVCDLKKGKTITNEQLLELPVDILVPAALENQITAGNADNIKASIILEMANGPTSAEADEVLYKRGIPVVPDVLANCGGVTVSYFEWKQNLDNEHWSEADVNKKLKRKMEQAFETVWETSKKKKVDLRTAAFIVAIKRIIEGKK